MRWRLEVDVKSATRLRLANPFFPGWRVRIDGRASPVSARPGEAFEIHVPAGRHRVEVLYRPASFAAGCAVAAVSALALLLLLRGRLATAEG